MAELRYNPLTKDWVMIASHRQNRPQMPKDWCPFCPASGKVPDVFKVLKYNNDFPALSQNPPAPDDVQTDLYKTKEAYGKCEVILYSPEHTVTLPELDTEHIRLLVDLWTERFIKISEDEKIKYIFIFENRGDVVGVTMPHPHGQIYGYSYIPKKLELELASCKEYYEENHNCLICEMIKNEIEFKKRVIIENDNFITFLPFYSEYPYGVYIAAKRHFDTLTDMYEMEKNSLASILKATVGTLDNLFDYAFPYMMCMHQSPVNSENTKEYFHFHIEFFPPMRSKEKQKFNASSETGAWAHCNPTAPEEKAEELSLAYKKWLESERI